MGRKIDIFADSHFAQRALYAFQRKMESSPQFVAPYALQIA